MATASCFKRVTTADKKRDSKKKFATIHKTLNLRPSVSNLKCIKLGYSRPRLIRNRLTEKIIRIGRSLDNTKLFITNYSM